MSTGQINSPLNGLQTTFISFYNNHSAALAHGDVIVKDLAQMVTDLAADSTDPNEKATATTTTYSRKILGVVFDPGGAGVAVGAHGIAMVRGFHPAVKVPLAAVTAAALLNHSTVALTAQVATTVADVLPGGMIGYAANHKTLTTTTTLPVYVDIK